MHSPVSTDRFRMSGPTAQSQFFSLQMDITLSVQHTILNLLFVYQAHFKVIVQQDVYVLYFIS